MLFFLNLLADGFSPDLSECKPAQHRSAPRRLRTREGYLSNVFGTRVVQHMNSNRGRNDL